MGRGAMTAAAVAWLASVTLAQEGILHSPHDLSVDGPGMVRATAESRVCIFCHAPHNTSPAAPLWNRHNPTTHYRIYQSSTTDARIDQPGGSSKMCLSCHDGSIALGLVLSREAGDPIPMTQTFMPSGPANLTNDLSDDHPIGLRFDRALSNRDSQLHSPDRISAQIQLGARGELECVACHDAHNNELGNFLQMTTREGALCVTCHNLDGWRDGAHANSPAAVPLSLNRDLPTQFASMRDEACNACHVSHSAPERERLLRARGDDLCLSCHNGLDASDITRVANLLSGHRPRPTLDLHDPAENPRTMRAHVNCVDCHNPHAAADDPLDDQRFLRRGSRSPLPAEMRAVAGVGLSGRPLERARQEYEVCLRCHADNPVPSRDRIVRQRDTLGNIRREILPNTASAHPLTFPARQDGSVPSLTPEARGITVMQCQDCHNNPDARALGGSGPNGPHGSRFEFLLADRYETADFTLESPQAYALCYQCHDRNSILGDESFSLHRVHIVDGRSSCSACHAPHGVPGSPTNHDHLINFDLRVVGGQRRFVDTGRLAGSCTLTCHGVQHVNFVYGPSSP